MASITVPTSAALRSQVQSKVVIVTGGASGIGLATARLFANHDAKVVLVDLDRGRLQAAVEDIGHGSTSFTCDVSSWTQQIRLFEWVSQNVGTPDIVCLNAGVDPELATASGNEQLASKAKSKVLTNYLAEEYEQSQTPNDSLADKGQGVVGILKKPPNLIFDVNVQGVIYGLKLAIHRMTSEGGPSTGGRVIITGSAGSYTSIAHQDIYAASKHAILGLMRSASCREELKKNNISVALVAPWLTTTAMTAEIASQLTEGTVASTAEDVAWAVGHLATARAEEINGTCVWVKGKEYIEVERSYGAWLRQLM